jgi:hypothetical protein
MEEKEAILLTKKHVLICMNEELDIKLVKELEYIKQNFCGIVLTDIKSHNYTPDTIVYFCGDVKKNYDSLKDKLVLVVKEFSTNYDKESSDYRLISFDQVPLNIFNVGVFFRNFFGDTQDDYFDMISKEHKFQTLTESNKPSNAFRKGIYLTPLKQKNDVIKYKLLRCSSNLSGPTDNFRETDYEVVGKVNEVSKLFFDNCAYLNHVLAQIYENKVEENEGVKKDKKAKIKAHSDKTKDMPRNGLIAFCTFYQNTGKNNYDASDLTKLRFRLKECVNDEKLEKKFDVTLYPNSVFIISLMMNRLYTHEIVPSSKPVDKIPIRMGYVIRCSKTDAVYENDQVYLYGSQMKEPDDEGVKRLKELYYKENATAEIIDYDKFYFSLNKGDYMKPLV